MAQFLAAAIVFVLACLIISGAPWLGVLIVILGLAVVAYEVIKEVGFWTFVSCIVIACVLLTMLFAAFGLTHLR